MIYIYIRGPANTYSSATGTRLDRCKQFVTTVSNSSCDQQLAVMLQDLWNEVIECLVSGAGCRIKVCFFLKKTKNQKRLHWWKNEVIKMYWVQNVHNIYSFWQTDNDLWANGITTLMSRNIYVSVNRKKDKRGWKASHAVIHYSSLKMFHGGRFMLQITSMPPKSLLLHYGEMF